MAREGLPSGQGQFVLAFGEENREFTLILQSLTPNERAFTTRVEGAAPTADGTLAPASTRPAGASDPELEIRRFDRRMLERIPAPAATGRRPGLAPAQELGSRRDFSVTNTTMPDPRDPRDFDEVSAVLRFVGDNTLVYVADPEPPSLTDAMVNEIGARFDDQTHGTNVAAFGSEGDIDDNGRVVILLTPVVNGLTTQQNVDDGQRLVGFFFALDLLPNPTLTPFSNGSEMFYAAVPDPERMFGPARFSVEEYVALISSTFAHEHQHMINASGRIDRGAVPEALWLDEGLSHFAEWVNGFTEQNSLRAALFVNDPSETSLVFVQDALPGRGAAYLFVQYLHDLLGDAVIRGLVQTSRTNVSNVQGATGRNFDDLFADWTAALLLDGTGTGDPAFEIPALDLRGDFARLKQTSFGDRIPNAFLNIASATLPEASVFLNQRGTTSSYLRLTAPAGGDAEVRINGESAANLQLGIARTR